MNTIAVYLQQVSVKLGEHLVLEDLSLEIPEGGFIAIIGPNGAGKTTFLRLLLGLLRPSAGQVKIFQKPSSQVPPTWIGYVPQIKTLDRTFPALSIELVISGLRQRWPGRIRSSERNQALMTLDRVNAAHLANRPLARLSGGELQRVYLARSLVRSPRLVMLDEPATGIDAVGEADMYRLLESYQQDNNATVLMITHDWHVAKHHASHVLVLNRRKIGFGPPERALSEECLRRAFGHVGHTHNMKFLKSDD